MVPPLMILACVHAMKDSLEKAVVVGNVTVKPAQITTSINALPAAARKSAYAKPTTMAMTTCALRAGLVA
jgi:hypothetical protein